MISDGFGPTESFYRLDDPAGEFLIDPVAGLAGLAGRVGRWGAGVLADPLLMVLVVALLVLLAAEARHARRAWKDWRHRRMLDGAQEILVRPPVEVDPAGVQLWWAQAAALLRRGGWRRLLYGPPHIAVEYRWAGRELSIVLWIPATVPVSPFAAAVRAAWPGATTTIRDARPPLGLGTAPAGGGPVDHGPAGHGPIDPGSGDRRPADETTTGGPDDHGPAAATPPDGVPGAGGHDGLHRRGRRRAVSHRRATSRQSVSPPVPPPANRPTAGPSTSTGPHRTRAWSLLQRGFDRWMDAGGPTRDDDTDVTRNPALPPPGDGAYPHLPGGYVQAASGRHLGARLPGWYVFRVRTEHGVDPLRAMIEQGAGLNGAESACVQILVRRPGPRTVRRVRAGAVGLKTGRREHQLPGPAAVAAWVPQLLLLALRGLLGAVEVLIDVASGSRTGRGRAPAPGAARAAAGNPLRDQDTRPALEKVRTGPLWEVGIRVAVVRLGPQPPPPVRRPGQRRRDDPLQARMHLLAHALTSALAVHDGRNGLHRSTICSPVGVLAARRMDGSRPGAFIVAGPELASMAALPTDEAVPGLDRARARAVPAPVLIPSGGRQVKVLGRAVIGGRKVGIRIQDARQHLHVLGATGSGKSSLLCRQVLADVHAGRGVVLIDPKGDLALDVLDRLPAGALPRLTLIDPDQPHGSAGFNPLQVLPWADADLLVDNLCAIFTSTFTRHWGPRMDDVLRNCCLTLMRSPGARLTSVPQLLNNKDFRTPYVAGLTDPAGLGGFWQWFESTPPALRSQVTGPVLARLRAFLGRDFVRRTIGVRTSTFDMGQILDGGILIARLPKGQLGENTSQLMGSMLLGSAWQAAAARARRPEHARRDSAIYTDEAHNVLHMAGSVTDMLAEARGYRVSFVLAHQNLAQLPAEVEQALAANARNKLFFNCSPADAKTLAQHTEPQLAWRDLASLDDYQAAARLMVTNRETSAFTLTTIPMPPPDPQARRRARAHITATGPRHDADDLPTDNPTARTAGHRRPTPRKGPPP
ncbi:TraM recognition domain-containing protein [Kineosporia sp. J2-2]|uniref:TraM recognition domain-containing protein n=1 Tax=Kineosporia corallincola TaxID=2835133 RepID=A0ABS5TPB6_9ACTN|nr:TraM recognition domain-containing protein [Kineosporia corallincola]MBT0772957.1 TraM recognition domain-containing protein [Kineosporia corallincola]